MAWIRGDAHEIGISAAGHICRYGFGAGSLSGSGVFPGAFYQGKVLKIINNDPGGVVSLRVKTVSKYLSKYIPGNPTIIVEIIDGGGGRRAANNVFQNAKPDGLTIGALSGSVVGLQVMRETGVMYDIDNSSISARRSARTTM